MDVRQRPRLALAVGIGVDLTVTLLLFLLFPADGLVHGLLPPALTAAGLGGLAAGATAAFVADSGLLVDVGIALLADVATSTLAITGIAGLIFVDTLPHGGHTVSTALDTTSFWMVLILFDLHDAVAVSPVFALLGALVTTGATGSWRLGARSERRGSE